MSPKQDVSDERKSQILDAAMETFAKKGFHKTRMSDIAESSGLSKGSLYWYFDSKDAIILKLIDRVFEFELKDLTALLTNDRSAEERLYIYTERGGQDIIKMLKWMPLIYDFLALSFRQETIKKTIQRYYKKNLDLLVTLIQQGIDAGEFNPRNALEAAYAVGSIVEGTVMLWLYDPEQIDIQDHIKSSTNLLLKGLKSSN
ncbi:MAG TPA: TetR/AcrR family transcriptional regulator [Chloroflexi bacterium]|nr:TetR/AcrR family transcriptional regulator [Chloroflexota bacterium]